MLLRIICPIISCKFVIDSILFACQAYGGIIQFCRYGKGIKYSQDQSSRMLLLEHNFKHNAVVLMMCSKF